jgi:hypothetical protein
LREISGEILEFVREAEQSGDLSLIIETERHLIARDLRGYTNNQEMTEVMNTALNEMAVIERHIDFVDDPEKYRQVDQMHSLPKNRKDGVPFDEARQALASHYSRLKKKDYHFMSDDERKITNARQAAFRAAAKLYTERQAKTLGIDLLSAIGINRPPESRHIQAS